VPEDTSRIKKFREELLQIRQNNTMSAFIAEDIWQSRSQRFIEQSLTKNPQSFLRWDVIQPMFVVNEKYVSTELAYLKSHPAWEKRWAKAIQEDAIGHPIPFWRYPSSSGNLIHHAYHISKLENEIAENIDAIKFVFEFGGGYGSMCRLFHKLGFRGRYVIYDIPIFSALQRFYLSSLGIIDKNPKHLKYNRDNEPLCTSDLEQVESEIKNLTSNDKTLFIATWSVSEVPIEMRASILKIAESLQYIFIAYQNQFEGIDNSAYFKMWVDQRSEFSWNENEIIQIPENKYLIGKKS